VDLESDMLALAQGSLLRAWDRGYWYAVALYLPSVSWMHNFETACSLL